MIKKEGLAIQRKKDILSKIHVRVNELLAV
jgi:hypothetical protein